MADNISEDVKNLKISETNGAPKEQASVGNTQFTPEDMYKLALHFYKDQDGKGLHPTYQDKLKMMALTKQASHGKYTPDASPDVGFLDVVGNHRKQTWIALGDMSKQDAMGEFVKMLESLCPQFTPYIQAKKAERDEQARKLREEEAERQRETEEHERKALESEAQKQLEMEKVRQQEQEKQIRAALNQQTSQQFKQYAAQQCPANIKQQEELIVQLQEQHFQQYMQQVYQQQLLHQQQQYQQLQAMNNQQHKSGAPPTQQQAPPTQQTPPSQPNASPPTNGTQAPPASLQHIPHTAIPTTNHVQQNGPIAPPINGQAPPTNATQTTENEQDTKDEDGDDELPPIAAASMWTRKDVKEFKDSLKKDKDSVIKVGSGETVTVRVPTHEDGSCLFWEFATDYYDVGFGVYFEWTIAPNNTVSVHVSESSDEEDIEEEEGGKGNDIEKGDKNDDRPPVDEIIPVYRRDCHEEVYCGSHAYPGRGVYLLKFDNSYSLWRSKTLYYRVYYSR